ncbi:MAG: nucleotide-binding protein, partial [Planctomycetota bacterium]
MQRDLQPELMDDPAIDPAEHRRALRGLDRIHRLTLTTRIVAHHLASLTHILPADHRLTLLDVACGGGA